MAIRSTIVVAPDSFKGSADAAEVARAIASGWLSIRPDDEVLLRPMADGGEGTVDAFELAVAGARSIPITVDGPDGRPVDTHFLLLPDDTGVVEIASTSGLTLLETLAPMSADSRGFGQAIGAALDAGAARLVLGLGGSSSTDGGVGALTALGARFLTNAGEPIASGGQGLADLTRIDLDGLRAVPAGGVSILSDVTNPLLGSRGAAAVFAPQKGADASEVGALENGLRRLAEVLAIDPETAGAGAAGGTGFGMLAWGATIEPGSRAVAELVGIPAALHGASLLIAGEGRFDGQSLDGKVVSQLLELSERSHVPVALIAGSIEAPTTAFSDTRSLSVLAGSPRAAMDDPLRWLTQAAAELASSFTTR